VGVCVCVCVCVCVNIKLNKHAQSIRVNCIPVRPLFFALILLAHNLQRKELILKVLYFLTSLLDLILSLRRKKKSKM
jgi:hypothetical protein